MVQRRHLGSSRRDVQPVLAEGATGIVEGRLRTRSWEGQDGQRRFRTEVIANTVLFLDRVQGAPLPEEEPLHEISEPDDLPFE